MPPSHYSRSSVSCALYISSGQLLLPGRPNQLREHWSIIIAYLEPWYTHNLTRTYGVADCHPDIGFYIGFEADIHCLVNNSLACIAAYLQP